MTCSGIWQPRVVFQNCSASDIWRILNYYEPLLLQNITYRSCYYLLIMEAEKFSVTHNARSETFISLQLKKQTHAVCIGNNIFASMKRKMTDIFYWWIWHKPLKGLNMISFFQCLIASLLKNTNYSSVIYRHWRGNPKARKPESGIGNRKPESETGIRNPESGIRNPESGIRKPQITENEFFKFAKIVLHSICR